MIIAFDGSRAFSDKRTGTENYSYQLLKALAKIDHKNTYKIFLRPNSVIPDLIWDPEVISIDSGSGAGMTKEGVGMTSSGWPSNFKFEILNFKFLWTQVGLSIKTFMEPMDVLFVPAHTLPLIRAPWVKTVVTVHDLGSEYLPQTHQIKQRLYLSLMQNYQLRTASKLIAVSSATKQDLIKKIGLANKNIEVIYEGFNDKLFNKVGDEQVEKVLTKANLARNGYFLFVGTVQPRKNIARLIEAFAKYSSSEAKPSREVISNVIPTIRQLAEGIHTNNNSDGSPIKSGMTTGSSEPKSGMTNIRNDKLVIVGKKGWMSEEIYALPKKLGIESQVKFLDYVKDEDLPALYGGAIALVYPSLFEGFGLPILEAQACGCPVITSKVSSMPEVLGDAGILIDPYSVEEIADAMIRVEGSKSRRVEMIKNGLENVKRFSWEKCAKETLKVLEGL